MDFSFAHMTTTDTSFATTASLAREISRLAQQVDLVAHRYTLVEVLLQEGEAQRIILRWLKISRPVHSQRSAFHVAAIDAETGRHLCIVSHVNSLSPACLVEVYAEVTYSDKSPGSPTHHARNIRLDSVPQHVLDEAHKNLLALKR